MIRKKGHRKYLHYKKDKMAKEKRGTENIYIIKKTRWLKKKGATDKAGWLFHSQSMFPLRQYSQ